MQGQEVQIWRPPCPTPPHSHLSRSHPIPVHLFNLYPSLFPHLVPISYQALSLCFLTSPSPFNLLSPLDFLLAQSISLAPFTNSHPLPPHPLPGTHLQFPFSVPLIAVILIFPTVLTDLSSPQYSLDSAIKGCRPSNENWKGHKSLSFYLNHKLTQSFRDFVLKSKNILEIMIDQVSESDLNVEMSA